MKRMAAFLLAWLFLSVHASAAPSAGQQPGGGDVSAAADAKTEGKIRVGLAAVKTGAVGKGINAAELAGAIQNTLAQYLKGTKVEVVQLEARLASAVEGEAKEKGCDYILYATVSHKKGGGGFGMFRSIAPVLGVVAPVAGVGAMIAGQVASTAVYAATANVKPKDEVTLEIKLQNGTAVAFAKQFKAKARGAGEDIITPVVEQAATALVETVGK